MPPAFEMPDAQREPGNIIASVELNSVGARRRTCAFFAKASQAEVDILRSLSVEGLMRTVLVVP